MAGEAKKVKRRKSLGLLFGSTGLLGSDGPLTSTTAASRPKSHGHTQSSPDNLLHCYNVDQDGQGENIIRRRRPSRPRSSGSLLAIMGVRSRSGSFSELQMRKMGSNRNRVSSNSFFFNDGPAMEGGSNVWHADNVPGLRARSKSLHKSKRNSMFGSFRSLGASMDDDRGPTRAHSKESSGEEDDLFFGFGNGISNRLSLGTKVLHHGEVQTSAPMWRKKTQYLVLTETHLVRFKSRSKAAETFPAIPAQWSRNTTSALTSNRLSVVSLASLQDGPVPGSGETGGGIALNRILAVHKLDDGRPFFSVEVCYMEERSSKTSSLQIQFTDPLDAELWRSGIRHAATEARVVDPLPVEPDSVEYISRTLDQERDYDPYSMSMHRAVRRLPMKPGGRSSIDENIKLASTPCYVVVGVHKIHILPISKSSNRTSMVSLNELETGQSYGILSLTALHMQRGDDGIQLIFRLPFKPSTHIQLSSAFSAEIALHIRQRAEYLRPQWIQQPYTFNVPRWLEEQVLPLPLKSEEDDGCFDRTLTAYCAAYDIDASNIRYSIHYSCEDAPCFQLLPPAGSKDGKGYSVLELLAVMKALRYNESFRTLSFGDVNLDVLQTLYDPYGFDYDAMRTRSNVPLDIPGQEQMSVLTQEIRALALKSKELRRMNFAFCLTRIPTMEKGEVDPGCGIPEAIFPLCRRRLTKVDWVVLNGIKLGDSDLDYLIDAASQKMSQLRALEISHCGISIHDLDLILSTMTSQESTLEAINISGVQGRLSAELFQQQIGYFAHIRKINLSHISRNTGPEPLIAPETLLNWELEEFSLSHTVVNGKTVDSIAAYLASGKSSKLRELRLDQCGLTGRDVATFLYFMVHDDGQPRNIHLHVSENRLHVDYSLLFDSIAQNKTPTHLTMRMMDFQKEDHFRQLLEAVRKNKSLKHLDISKASLPYDAGPETCKALQMMFEENTTMEELDISGEYAHLDVARFGIGLNLALTGLKKNNTLKVLRIEHQKLGLQGANTLASVLEENNSLLEVYCENNEINLQSFTVLVNGLQRNKTLLHLPCMARDREQSMEKVRREIEAVNKESKAKNANTSTAGSIRRTIQAAVGSTSATGTKLTKPNKTRQSTSHLALSPSPSSAAATSKFTDPEVQAILESLGQKWDLEVERLQRYLYRNYNLAHGITQRVDENGSVVDNCEAHSDSRPGTAASLATFLEQLSFETNQDRPFLNVGTEAQVEGSGGEMMRIMLPRPAPFQSQLSDISSLPSPEPKPAESSSYILPSSTDLDRTITDPTLSAPTPAHPRPMATRSQTGTSFLSGISSSASVNTSNASATGIHNAGGNSKVTSASSSLRSILSSRTPAEKLLAQKKKENRVTVTFAHAPRLELNLPSLDLS
ncbi:hypothetical protein PRK78_007481 [Emydomyces testavorans]|uniref:LRR-containing protein second PH domain-containing protein n=1 Tax=Emydomyces testavorans TaxID=2070801 RepID=A0AAF0DNA3_9EURO|nr:hypothetical protein PRK78_007481 [Emydomyces testavorans]